MRSPRTWYNELESNMKEGKLNPTLESLKEKLRALKPFLEAEYGVKEIGIFGSYVRGEESPTSDLDILVDFEKPIGLLKFVDLKLTLSERLGVEVDLVMKSALKPRIGKRILQEVVHV